MKEDLIRSARKSGAPPHGGKTGDEGATRLADGKMVERVARAIFRRSVYLGYSKETLEMEWLRNQSIFTAKARAAIEAMREPTEEMYHAQGRALKVHIDSLPEAERAPFRCNPSKAKTGLWIKSRRLKARLRWEAMIDAALAEREA